MLLVSLRHVLIPNLAAAQLVGPFPPPLFSSSNFVAGNVQEPRNELSLASVANWHPRGSQALPP